MASEREPSEFEATQRIEDTLAIFDEHATLALAMCLDGHPFAAKAFFIEDEPGSGKLDMCCMMLINPERRAAILRHPSIAFVVAGMPAEHWIQGSGRLDVVQDDADAGAILKRLRDKTPSAAAFLGRVDCTPVRIHVERLKVTDLDADPPVAEFTFA